ncbi:MAG: DUF3592 domain-containing protein [Phycisphaerae bacterium]|nr:DUF3592 domain-containing protein [Phycisphaerae bacterium]
MPRGLIVLSAVTAVLGLAALSGWFTVRLARQHTMITGWQPVQADIELSRPLTQGSGRTARYWPGVTYRYAVAGKNYRADGVLPVPREGSLGWAQSVADRFPVGARTTAYVNPANPAEAFLLRQAHPSDYAFAALPWVGIALALGWALGGPRDGRTRSAADAEPVSGGAGWHEVPPVIGRRARLRRQAAMVGAMAGVVPYWTHMAVYGPFDRLDQFVGPVLSLGLLGYAAWTLWRQWNDARRFGDAIVLVRPWPARAGERLEVKVSAIVHLPAPEATVGVGARGWTLTQVRTGKGRRIVESHAWSADGGSASTPLMPGVPVRGEATLTVPSAAPPSGLEVPRSYPASRAGLIVTVRAGVASTVQSHVLRVEPASGVEQSVDGGGHV